MSQIMHKFPVCKEWVLDVLRLTPVFRVEVIFHEFHWGVYGEFHVDCRGELGVQQRHLDLGVASNFLPIGRGGRFIRGDGTTVQFEELQVLVAKDRCNLRRAGRGEERSGEQGLQEKRGKELP